MQLNVSFKNADPSPAVVAHVEHRARTLAAKAARECRLRVVCGYDAGYADVEVVGRIGRDVVIGRARDIDMHDAVDDAFEKILHQSKRALGVRMDRRHQRGRHAHDDNAARHP